MSMTEEILIPPEILCLYHGFFMEEIVKMFGVGVSGVRTSGISGNIIKGIVLKGGLSWGCFFVKTEWVKLVEKHIIIKKVQILSNVIIVLKYCRIFEPQKFKKLDQSCFSKNMLIDWRLFYNDSNRKLLKRRP